MAKFNVGVGDAFPVDQTGRPADAGPPPPDGKDSPDGSYGRRHDAWRDDLRDRWRERRRRYRGAHGAFQAVFILLGIWLVLYMVNGTSVRGLLIAAGIVGAVGLASHFFGRAAWERREQHREERRAERRRRRDERNGR